LGQLKDQRFSAEDLEAIVERATVLQEQSQDRETVLSSGQQERPRLKEGMTLQTIQEISAEVGVAPRFVEEAARSLLLDKGSAGSEGAILGAPVGYEVVGIFPGLASDQARSNLIDAIRRSTGHEGEVREVLGAVEWATVGRVTKTTVSIRDGDGTTDVQVRADASGLAAFTWVGSVGLGLLAGGVVAAVTDPMTTFGVASIMGAGGAVGVGAARAVWSRVGISIQAGAQRLRDEVGELLSGLPGAED